MEEYYDTIIVSSKPVSSLRLIRKKSDANLAASSLPQVGSCRFAEPFVNNY